MTSPPQGLTDPIVAVATAPGRGAVGIVRLSSPVPLDPLIERLCGAQPPARQARLATVRDADGAPVDQVLVLHFPAPASFTGEHVLELQGHGGPVVLQRVIERCLAVAGEPTGPGSDGRLPRLRLARAGEFSERAFLNGRLDLAQAEAVADLIDADTEAAARAAARSLDGEFSREVQGLAREFEALRLLVEATLDFPEEDIDFVQAADVAGRLERLRERLEQLRGHARQGALLREGLHVVLAGVPNAGKSSLLNALAGEDLAIVTPIAGTTRDRIRQSLAIDGVPLHLVDTAGLRDTHDEVERLGVARSWQSIAEADLVLWLHDLTRAADPGVLAEEQAIAAGLVRLRGPLPADDGRVVHAFNKADALDDTAVQAAISSIGTALEAAGAPIDTARGLRLSATRGDGLDRLRTELLTRAGWQRSTEGLFLARTRHLQALARTAEHLAAATRTLQGPHPPLDLLAEDLRLAHRALGEITGEFTTEDLLGAIFSRFCIGK